jgi:RNA polymerase sigma-70 factor (ECF subfamily)
MQSDKSSADPPRSVTMEELFIALEAPLLGYAMRLVRPPEVAEEIVQEAFMRLHPQFGNVRAPDRWLYRTVHNLALNHLRQAKKIVPLHGSGGDDECGDTMEATDPQPLPDEQIARWEGIGLVRLSLKTLDDRSREIVRLKFNENLSYKEISARTGLKAGHVGYLLHHALKAIAGELSKSGVIS